MASSLSNLANNLSEGIHIIKCKFEHDDKTCETYGIKSKYSNCFLEYTNYKEDLIEYKCLCCNKSYQRTFAVKLRNDILIHTSFLTMITISLFCCYEKTFVLIVYTYSFDKN